MDVLYQEDKVHRFTLGTFYPRDNPLIHTAFDKFKKDRGCVLTMEDTPYTPDEVLWEDTTEETSIASVPEWAGEPSVPVASDSPRCAVPMCGEENPNLLRLGCVHYLHEGCMSKIFKATRHPECPMCHDGYLAQMRRIVESSSFTTVVNPPSVSALSIDPFVMPIDSYGPPEPIRPPGATRYGEQFDPTQRSEPISYGGRFRHMDRHNANQHTAQLGPTPCQPFNSRVNMMGLEARQSQR